MLPLVVVHRQPAMHKQPAFRCEKQTPSHTGPLPNRYLTGQFPISPKLIPGITSGSYSCVLFCNAEDPIPSYRPGTVPPGIETEKGTRTANCFVGYRFGLA